MTKNDLIDNLRQEMRFYVILLHQWARFKTDCFASKFFDLLDKADKKNVEKLQKVFPELVNVWIIWKESPDNGQSLFKLYGISNEYDDHEGFF